MASTNPDAVYNAETGVWEPPPPRENPLQRRHHVLMRRQQGKHALQRRALDQEVVDQYDTQEYAQRLQERRAELRDAKPGDAAVAAELEQIDVELREVEAQLSFATAVNAHRGARMRGLVDKQRRDRAVLNHRLSSEMKGQAAVVSAGAEQAQQEAGDGEGAGAAAASSAGGGSRSKSGAAAAAASSSSSSLGPAALIGYRVCDCCGAQYRRMEGKSCFDCLRDVCGKGGRGVVEPLGGPCVDVYRCGSCILITSAVCHDCVTASATRGDAYYRRCEVCDSWICHRCPQASCKTCGMAPVCRGCRPEHEKQCKADDDEDEDS